MALYPDLVRVGLRLLAALKQRPDGAMGTIATQPFRRGDPEDAVAAGRRALVVLGASLAPNGYVLRAPQDRDVLVMHRLAAASPNPDAAWPV